LTLMIKLNHERCVGHARCAAKAPEVFQVGDDDASPSDGRIVPLELRARALLGVAACPEGALELVLIEDPVELNPR
jgi:ferredoxin